MIEMMRHLRLVQRKHALPVAGEDVAVQLPAVASSSSRVRNRSESSVMLKRCLNVMPHGLPSWLRLVPQHWDAAVDRRGEVGVPAVAEDRQRPGVRVDEGELLRAEREHPASVVEVGSVEQEEREPRGRLAQSPCRPGRAGRTCSWRGQPGKSGLPVLEVVQRGDGAALGEVAEQVLAAGAGGDGGRDDAADAASRRGDRREPFGEQLVGLQRVDARFASAPWRTAEMRLSCWRTGTSTLTLRRAAR